MNGKYASNIHTCKMNAGCDIGILRHVWSTRIEAQLLLFVGPFYMRREVKLGERGEHLGIAPDCSDGLWFLRIGKKRIYNYTHGVAMIRERFLQRETRKRTYFLAVIDYLIIYSHCSWPKVSYGRSHHTPKKFTHSSLSPD